MTPPAFQVIMRVMGWNRMRRVLCVATLVGGVMLSVTCFATGGGGIESRLLAFAGANQRYAVFVEQASGDSSSSELKVYAVDTEAPEFRRLWPYVWKATEAEMEIADATLYARFEKSLAPANKARLTPPGRLLTKEQELPPKTVDENTRELVWTVRGHTVEATLKQLYTFDAMAKFDHEDTGGGFTCDVCSTCKQVKVWADGEPKKITQCQRGKGVRRVSDEVTECNCYGRGVALALELRDKALSRAVVGSKFLVVPYELNGGFKATAREPLPQLELKYDPYTPTVAAQVNASGTLVVYGFAVEEPTANPKHYPVVAIYRIPADKTAESGKENGRATGREGTKKTTP